MTSLPIVRVSASQISTYRDCERKWGIAKIDGIKEPTSPFQQWGLDAHDIAEMWGKEKRALPDTPQGEAIRKMILKGTDWLPAPLDPHSEWEGLITPFEIAPNVLMTGRKDISYTGFLPDKSNIRDLKTTSNLRWALTEETLRVDTQAVIYAQHEMMKHGTTVNQNDWLYVTRDKNPKLRKVTADIPKDSEEWFQVVEDSRIMAGLKRAIDPGKAATELTPNPRACGKYGGCPYKGKQCVLPNGDSLFYLFTEEEEKPKKGQKTMGILDEMRDEESQEANPAGPSGLPAKKKRGRPKGSKNKNTNGTNGTDPVLAKMNKKKGINQISHEEAHPPQEKQNTKPDRVSFTLYIDCQPAYGWDGGEVVWLREVIKTALTADGKHWTAQGGHYTEAKTALELEVARLLDSGAFNGKHVVASRSSTEFSVVGDLLRQAAGQVVQ